MSRALIGLFVIDLRVNTSLWLVLDPLTDEELVLVVVEVTALSLTEVIYPVTLEVVSVSFS